jgi:hypothetical protein
VYIAGARADCILNNQVNRLGDRRIFGNVFFFDFFFGGWPSSSETTLVISVPIFSR